MNKENMYFTEDHEWVKTENGVTYIGISDYAQNALGDIVYVELPGEGDVLSAGKPFGSVESVKAVSELCSPVSGTVVSVNEALDDAPELLNENPYENWIATVELDDPSELSGLMDEQAYDIFCAKEG